VIRKGASGISARKPYISCPRAYLPSLAETPELALDVGEASLDICEPSSASGHDSGVGAVCNRNAIDRCFSMDHEWRREIARLADMQKLVSRDRARAAFHSLDCRE
jgi:hypothetical protein